jgi:hypothetical protein
MKRKGNSAALTRSRKIVIVLAVIILGAVSFYLFYSIDAGEGYPPFCSGYPPGGNCHANYSYTFTVSLNYSGSWVLEYYGFHNGENASIHSDSYYLSSGNITGSGSYTKSVTLSGDDYYFLNLCARAQKLDNSNSTLALTVTGSNSTSLPMGSTYYFGGVVP